MSKYKVQSTQIRKIIKNFIIKIHAMSRVAQNVNKHCITYTVIHLTDLAKHLIFDISVNSLTHLFWKFIKSPKFVVYLFF